MLSCAGPGQFSRFARTASVVYSLQVDRTRAPLLLRRAPSVPCVSSTRFLDVRISVRPVSRGQSSIIGALYGCQFNREGSSSLSKYVYLPCFVLIHYRSLFLLVLDLRGCVQLKRGDAVIRRSIFARGVVSEDRIDFVGGVP